MIQPGKKSPRISAANDPLEASTAAPAVSTGGTPSSNLEDCYALLAFARAARARPGLAPRDYVAFCVCLSKIMALRARLERDRELNDPSTVLGLPAWLRLERTLLSTLQPYPAVAAAVRKAITDVFSTEHTQATLA